MNIGDRVRFHRPGATGDFVYWNGMIEAVNNGFYLIRDQSTGKLRVVPQSEKWLLPEKENEQIEAFGTSEKA